MATIPPNVIESIARFLSKITSDIPVKKSILFGSFASGIYDEDSDIDLAPIAFISEEYEGRLGIVDEILKTGMMFEN